MSLSTWMRKYYKQEAVSVLKRNALEHSILKWTGLLKKNLKEHHLVVDGRGIVDKRYNRFVVDDRSCALCIHYEDAGCGDCPLFKVLGNRRCDDNFSDGTISPYRSWVWGGIAKPMLMWLKRARKVK